MIRGRLDPGGLVAAFRVHMQALCTAVAMLAATPAQAELILCNRTSYRVDAAIGLEKRVNVATYGWFRIDPCACRQLVDGVPMPQAGQADLCIRGGDFAIVNARACPVNQQARFTAAQPADSPKGGEFELSDHKDCATRGLNTAGFAVIDLGNQRLTTVRFKEP